METGPLTQTFQDAHLLIWPSTHRGKAGGETLAEFSSITELEYWPKGRVLGGSPRYTALLRVCDTSHLADCWSDL